MTVKAYLVGGTVRDILLGLKPKDIDYAVEAGSYEEMRDWVLAQGGKIFIEITNTSILIMVECIWI